MRSPLRRLRSVWLCVGFGWIASTAARAQAAPTREETAVLCWINRFRRDPQAFARLVLAGPRPANSEGVDWALFQAELEALRPAPPLFHEPRLLDAARSHARYMPLVQEYGHHETKGSPGFLGEWPTDRARSAGYTDPVEECACARGASPFEIVAGYVVDAAPPGTGIGGMQERRGHRAALIDQRWTDVGIGLAAWGQGQWSNVVLCGAPTLRARVLGGVALEDRDEDGFYGVGEGLADVHVRAGEQSTLTAASGAWRLDLPADSSVRTLVARLGELEITRPLDARSARQELDLRFELERAVQAIEQDLAALAPEKAAERRALRVRLLQLRAPRTEAEQAFVREIDARKSAILQLLGAGSASETERAIQAGAREFAGTALVAWFQQARTADRLARTARALRSGPDTPSRARRAITLATQIERAQAEIPSHELWRRLQELRRELLAR